MRRSFQLGVPGFANPLPGDFCEESTGSPALCSAETEDVQLLGIQGTGAGGRGLMVIESDDFEIGEFEK